MSMDVAKVLECLNKARGMEMQAIHQYMIQKYLVWDMDLGQLAPHLQLIAIDEMKHARRFACRIDELNGEPNCQMSGTIIQNQTIEEIFPCDAKMETETIDVYSDLAGVCRKAGDPSSAGLFEAIIQEEAVHLAYYKATANHIKTLGNAFLAKFAGQSKDPGPIHSFVKLQAKEQF